jgi:Ankyrin repeats (many copies)
MNRIIWIIAIAVVLSIGYVGYVWAWSIPRDETNRANLILGGCESKESVSRSNWPLREKFVPPVVRCAVRDFRKEQILSANFRWAERTDVPITQFYIDVGELDMIPRSILSDYRIANWGIVLRSLDWLFENGADPNQCGRDGLTALHLAVYFERPDLYKKWVSLGADPDNACEKQSYIEPSGRTIDRVEGTARDWLKERITAGN